MSFWRVWLVGAAFSFPYLLLCVRDMMKKRIPEIERSLRDESVPEQDRIARKISGKSLVELHGSEEALTASLEKQLNYAVLVGAVIVSFMWFIFVPVFYISRNR